jgi:hypothetical protein
VEPARVAVVANEPEADMACALLRSEGIECFHRRTYFAAGAADAGSSIGGPREIWVNEDDLERARELLEDESRL